MTNIRVNKLELCLKGKCQVDVKISISVSAWLEEIMLMR